MLEALKHREFTALASIEASGVASARSAGIAASARVETAELGTAATIVATHRPFAIVISEDVYGFDAAEFDALARDVNATLLKINVDGADRDKTRAGSLERATLLWSRLLRDDRAPHLVERVMSEALLETIEDDRSLRRVRLHRLDICLRHVERD